MVEPSYLLKQRVADLTLNPSQIRSPMDGVVATPNVENMVGRRLQFGDTFAEVVDTSRAVVDVAIEDDDAGLLAKQAPASIKLNSFPMRTLHGEVAIVSPRSALVWRVRRGSELGDFGEP